MMDVCCHLSGRDDAFRCSIFSCSFLSSHELQQQPGLSFPPFPCSWQQFLLGDQETAIVAVTRSLAYSFLLPYPTPFSLFPPSLSPLWPSFSIHPDIIRLPSQPSSTHPPSTHPPQSVHLSSCSAPFCLPTDHPSIYPPVHLPIHLLQTL